VVVVHDDRQTLPLHVYAPQLVDETGLHTPAPLHVRAGVKEPAVQLAGAQPVVDVGKGPHDVRVAPSHCASHPPDPAHGVRVPRGAPETAMHVPTLPPTLQASHCPMHAVLQHVPSAEFPLRQAAPLVEGWPFRNKHVPDALQLLVPEHVSGSSALVTAMHAPVDGAHFWQLPHAAAQQYPPSAMPLKQLAPLVAG
jgi:hypothetical protein